MHSRYRTVITKTQSLVVLGISEKTPDPTKEVGVSWWILWNDNLVFILFDQVLLKDKQRVLLIYLLPFAAGKDEWIVLGAEIVWLGKLGQKGGDQFLCDEKADTEADSARGQRGRLAWVLNGMGWEGD